jgi:uncharacterized protein (TIGR04255 family)
MNPPFPEEISPSPIVTSTIEIRFSSDLAEADALSFFYPIFASILPTVKGRPFPIPSLKNQHPELKYWAEYSLNNDDFTVLIGNNVIAFNITNSYSLWSNYFNFIKSCINKLFDNERIKKIEKIAVRYINLFENETKLEPILDSKLSFPFQEHGYSIEQNHFVTTIVKEKISMQLQLADNFQLVHVSRGPIKGVYIDIDASQTSDLPQNFSESLLKVIDSIHSEAKSIFFLLLKADYIVGKLNPKF